MYADQAVQCSWEGDNTILTLQSGRSLISSYLEAKGGKKLADGVSYLNDLPKSLNAKCQSDKVAADMDTMDDAWKCVAANVVQKAAVDFDKHVKAGENKDVAFELCSQERFIAAKVSRLSCSARIFFTDASFRFTPLVIFTAASVLRSKSSPRLKIQTAGSSTS